MKISMRNVRYMNLGREKIKNGGIREAGYYYTSEGSKVYEITKRGRGIIVESLSYGDKMSYSVFKAIVLKFFDKFSHPNSILKHEADGKTYYSLIYGRENMIDREIQKMQNASGNAEVLNMANFYKDVLR